MLFPQNPWEGMNAFILFTGRVGNKAERLGGCGGVTQLQVAGRPAFAPPWKTLRSIWRLLRCTSLPPPPHLHHSAGRNYFFYWKFSILACIQRERKDENKRKKVFSALQLAGRLGVCVCLTYKQRK